MLSSTFRRVSHLPKISHNVLPTFWRRWSMSSSLDCYFIIKCNKVKSRENNNMLSGTRKWYETERNRERGYITNKKWDAAVYSYQVLVNSKFAKLISKRWGRELNYHSHFAYRQFGLHLVKDLKMRHPQGSCSWSLRLLLYITGAQFGWQIKHCIQIFKKKEKNLITSITVLCRGFSVLYLFICLLAVDNVL